MAQTAGIQLSKSMQFGDLLELSKDYCSDHLGRFFQNNYSPAPKVANKFAIPAKLATRSKQQCFAICVMMNNHIVDLKYFDDIFFDADNQQDIERIMSGQNLANIDVLMNDHRFLSAIKSFKKINDEIVIGHCQGREFTPL